MSDPADDRTTVDGTGGLGDERSPLSRRAIEVLAGIASAHHDTGSFDSLQE
jgi:hypothetical protein